MINAEDNEDEQDISWLKNLSLCCLCVNVNNLSPDCKRKTRRGAHRGLWKQGVGLLDQRACYSQRVMHSKRAQKPFGYCIPGNVCNISPLPGPIRSLPLAVPHLALIPLFQIQWKPDSYQTFVLSNSGDQRGIEMTLGNIKSLPMQRSENTLCTLVPYTRAHIEPADKHHLGGEIKEPRQT